MQPNYLYKNKDDMLYFLDHQYQNDKFKFQYLCYHTKKRMKEIEIDQVKNKGNIIML